MVRWCWIDFQCRVCPTYLDKSRVVRYLRVNGPFELVYDIGGWSGGAMVLNRLPVPGMSYLFG